MKVRSPLSGPRLLADSTFAERQRLLHRRRRQRLWHTWLVTTGWLFGMALVLALVTFTAAFTR